MTPAQPNPSYLANGCALGAIALWGLLAVLGVALQHLPPFLLTGLALVIGSVWTWPAVLRDRRQWAAPPRLLALGVFTLFGFHFLLFIALRLAPAVEVNLVNYLWPLLMVLLAPLYLPGLRLSARHLGAALLGFAGAATAMLGGSTPAFTSGGAGVAGGADTAGSSAGWAYLLALASALIWANFSLQTKRAAARGAPFPTAAIGLFGLLSGLLALLSHALLEPPTTLSTRDWLLVALMGLGPLGAAFLLWGKALALGDARQIGILSYLTPLLSTAALVVFSNRPMTWSIGLAALMITSAALLGARAAAQPQAAGPATQ